MGSHDTVALSGRAKAVRSRSARPCRSQGLATSMDSTAKRTAVRSSFWSSSLTNDGHVRRSNPSASMYERAMAIAFTAWFTA